MLVSGMIIGTLFTLFVVPSIYVLVARTRVAEGAAVRDEAVVPGGFPTRCEVMTRSSTVADELKCQLRWPRVLYAAVRTYDNTRKFS